ncbi:MAG: substrate-binding domain-containing protein [Rickettsiales bacterium]|nr:substrate-binding domain-containing protein [Rickettsiales bacterium]
MKLKIIIVTSIILSNLLSLNSKADIKDKAPNNFKRKHLQIVGSSTVYPFIANIAEDFSRIEKLSDKNAKTPIVESNGTGGGFKLFCSGIGELYPDFINASRKIEISEIKYCESNKINIPIEIRIGYDGIVLAGKIINQQTAIIKNLSLDQLFLALIAETPDENGRLEDNKYKKWNEINPQLPNIPIRIYGPPTSSGTRDAFVELAIEKPCMNHQSFVKLYPDKNIRQKKCRVIRTDGVFIEAGENDNLIIQKLINDEKALGIFGFNFLQENQNIITGIDINNINPNIKNITSQLYPISRPLFIYAKKEHLNYAYKMNDFILEIIGNEHLGINGDLTVKGLIPLQNQELRIIKESIEKQINYKNKIY